MFYAPHGIALLVVGSIFALLAGFRESVLWGLGMLFVPFVGLIFLVMHWSKAKNSFFLQLYGLGFLIAGAIAFDANLPWPL